MDIHMVALNDQVSRPCDVGNEVLKRLETSGRIQIYPNIDRRCLGPFEVRERAVDIMGGRKPEASPERRIRCKGSTPVSTDVCGGNQIPVASSMFQYVRQDLWWEPVDERKRVLDRPCYP